MESWSIWTPSELSIIVVQTLLFTDEESQVQRGYDFSKGHTAVSRQKKCQNPIFVILNLVLFFSPENSWNVSDCGINIICNVDVNINIGTEMATSKPGREEEKLRRWGKKSFKGEWGEDESNCLSLLLSSLIFIGSHKGVTWEVEKSCYIRMTPP